MKMGTFIWELLHQPKPRDLPLSDSLIASQDTANNPAQTTTNKTKRAANRTS